MNSYLSLSQISTISNIKRHTLNARLKSDQFFSELKRSGGNRILLAPNQTKKIISDQLLNVKGKFLFVGNLKGGVGKTTLAYLLSNACSVLGLKTCVIDLDVQSNITRQYIKSDIHQPVFYDVINKNRKIDDVIVPITETLHIIPSSLQNSLIEKELTMQSPKNYLKWFNTICLDYLRKNFDVIVVDTPPHLTTINSVFCLCLTSNDHILIPVCAEEFSIMGVKMFLDDVVEIRDSFNVHDNVSIAVVMNKFLQNQKTNLEILVKMGQRYGDMMSEIIIRDNAKIREIMNNKLSMGDIKKGKEVYEAISSLLQEIKILKKMD